MASKRTPTGKYREARGLLRTIPGAYRLLYDVLWNECDYAGIWDVDFEFAQIAVGLPVTEADALRYFGRHIQVVEGGDKWYLTTYVGEQVGDGGLSEKNPVHQNILKRLQRFGLDPFPDRVRSAAGPPPDRPPTIDGPENAVFDSKNEPNDGPCASRPRTVDGTNTNYINNITVLEKDKRVNKLEIFEAIFSDEIFLESLAIVHRDKDIKQAFEECFIHFSAAKRPPDSVGEWKQKLNTWLSNAKTNAPKIKPSSNLRQELAARIAQG